MRLHDAHNHLQDDRFAGRQAALIAQARSAGVSSMVVNGTTETDWPLVLDLARRFPMVLPSFGYHPWHVACRTPGWSERLAGFLETVPSGVGEIGLDRWKPELSYDGQEEVFRVQLTLAAERNLPVSIHCLQAWGRLLELLRAGPVPATGFLLHSFGGPVEMVPELTALGAYFGFPGAFLHARKARHQAAFHAIPRDRILIETDAPDQRLPTAAEAATPVRPILEQHPEPQPPVEAGGPVINHPANLAIVHRGLAIMLATDPAVLAQQLEDNFMRLFRKHRPLTAAPPGA